MDRRLGIERERLPSILLEAYSRTSLPSLGQNRVAGVLSTRSVDVSVS